MTNSGSSFSGDGKHCYNGGRSLQVKSENLLLSITKYLFKNLNYFNHLLSACLLTILCL